MYLNGKRLVLTGVNRHEWNAKTGRCIGIDEMTSDIECIVRNNINAVRTCHYPDQIPWYYMCDKAGIYVMAETNLESHGTFQKLGAIEPSCNIPGSIPQWKEAVVDRARTNFETFKNHTSVLFWSLGNESAFGCNFSKMTDVAHEMDPTRLVHYEGDFDVESADVYSTMYTWIENPKKPYLMKDIIEKSKKTHIHCEYCHAMGNGPGNLKDYQDLVYAYE